VQLRILWRDCRDKGQSRRQLGLSRQLKAQMPELDQLEEQLHGCNLAGIFRVSLHLLLACWPDTNPSFGLPLHHIGRSVDRVKGWLLKHALPVHRQQANKRTHKRCRAHNPDQRSSACTAHTSREWCDDGGGRRGGFQWSSQLGAS
jgi:hypothetical protein